MYFQGFSDLFLYPLSHTCRHSLELSFATFRSLRVRVCVCFFKSLVHFHTLNHPSFISANSIRIIVGTFFCSFTPNSICCSFFIVVVIAVVVAMCTLSVRSLRCSSLCMIAIRAATAAALRCMVCLPFQFPVIFPFLLHIALYRIHSVKWQRCGERDAW